MKRLCMLTTVLVLIACSNDGGRPAGSEGGPCYGNGTCDGTLTCIDEICRDLSDYGLDDGDTLAADSAPDDPVDVPDDTATDGQSDQSDLSDDTVTDTALPDEDTTDEDALLPDADSDTAECVDGAIFAVDCEGSGKQVAECAGGQWGEFGECLDITQAVIDLADGSACADYYWEDRGDAPPAYTRGMALVFAGAFCHRDRSDVALVSASATTDTEHDALAWYDQIFSDLGMDNSAAGVDTLRHAYTLLIGLGMRESSGEHCCGRDMSADNVTADTAEAGLFQTSYNSHMFSDELDTLYADWKVSYEFATYKCLLDVFSEDVYCSDADWENYGTGEGVLFQDLEKRCPIFAAEYAAVMLRVSGGSKGHYGPLRTRAAEVRPECDAMFAAVQALIQEYPHHCQFLVNY